MELAPRVTRHGVLVEVYGEGILLVGGSGAWVRARPLSSSSSGGTGSSPTTPWRSAGFPTNPLVGQAPENIRHFIELRGIGIINARRIFGMGAVKLTEKIDMCINMELWDATKVYDRMGIDSEYTEILGIRVAGDGPSR